MSFSLLLALGPLVLAEPTALFEVELLADRARIAEVQRCLAAEQRVRVREDEALEDRWWPFATDLSDASRDAARCGLEDR